MSKNDGGMAFPTMGAETYKGYHVSVINPGMSLHQWFAGMALQGTLASEPKDGFPENFEPVNYSISVADAMLEAYGEMEDKKDPVVWGSGHLKQKKDRDNG